jgi:hypothetical protein
MSQTRRLAAILPPMWRGIRGIAGQARENMKHPHDGRGLDDTLATYKLDVCLACEDANA